MPSPAPTRAPLYSGGCQCGAVRYALYAAPERHSICWCRMCQKANGAYMAAHTGVKRADFAWTRGTPGTFRSSEAVERDFCRDCGTPLTYRNLGVDRVSITIPSLDEPYAVTPEQQYGTENRPPFAANMAHLPEVPTDTWLKPEDRARYASRQHPDKA
ncbi:MAG: GFA family protein [Hyphomicrobiaceae bacterium]